MKKIVNIITVTLLLVVTLTSCDKFLGNKPKGYTIPQYYEDYALLMNNISFDFLGTLYPTYLTDDIELSGVNVSSFLDFNAKYEEERNCYTFKKGDIFAQGANDNFYSKCYNQIYTYNVIINNIMSVSDGIEEDKKNLKAEALVHRAFAYFKLLNTYAIQYNKTTAATDYGVPIVLSEDINSTYIRNTIAEGYELITNDLSGAVNELKENTQNPFHPNKSAGYALFARVYLYMGEYDLALQNAKEALKYNHGELLDYKKYKLNDSPESGYWDRIVDNNDIPMPSRADNTEFSYIKLPPNDHSSYVFASDDLMKTFEKNLPTGAVDKRKELFYAKDYVNTYEEMSFPGYTIYAPHILPNMGISLQEIYLTLAECEARIASGTKEQALAYLDIVRNMRIVNNKPLVAADKEEALKIVLDERRREMAFWGDNRFSDLRRLNVDNRFAKTVIHNLDGAKYELPANDLRYVMPLPYSVREFNPDIPQYNR